MTTQTNNPTITKRAGAALTAYRLVTLDSNGDAVHADGDAGNRAIGVVQEGIASGDLAPIRLFSAGTCKMVAAVAIARENVVYRAASGKITDDAAAGHEPVGIALEASTADGDVIEVLPIHSLNEISADPTDLTDSSGGTANNTIVDAAASTTNITDSTGETPDDTIADVSTAVTGVDGTGSNAASKADVDTRLGAINQNFSDLAAKVNAIHALLADVAKINDNFADVAAKINGIHAILATAKITP